jgi:two-component system, OmpR family, sensor histidine kinase VanS
VSARLRLALSYAAFLVAAGAILLFGLYLVLRYVPDYPLTAANPRDSGTVVATRTEILGAVAGVSGLALIGLALVGLVGGWFLAGWILSPLRRINEAVAIAATGDLEHRIKLGGRNDEFTRLADGFDHMLEQLHDAFEVQERFAANASHELRTPLAVMSTMLEVAQRDPDSQDYPALVERLHLTNARAIALTESLLRLADANSISAVAVAVDLSLVVRTAIEENSAEASARDVAISAQYGDATVLGEASLVSQLVTNLVQNAIRHGGSPGAVRVATSATRDGTRVSLRVESGGAVFSAESAARLTEPFLKGAGRISGSERGYGLGLALVERIAHLHDGSLTIEPRREGGLVITVELPRLGT